MRVLRITPLWDWRALDPTPPLRDPGEGLGGHAAQVLGITRACARVGGIEQTVVTLRAAGGPATARLMDDVLLRGVGPGGVSGVHRRNLAWLIGVLDDLPARRRQGFDVVHVHASGIVEPLWAALAARRVLSVPLVLTLHHSAQATYVASSRRDAVVQVVTRRAERDAVRAAARTLVLTARTAERIDGDGVEIMADSLEVGAFAAHATADAGRALRGRLGIPADAPVAVFAGRLSAEKGWRDLLGLERVIDGLHIIVCGDGPDREPAQRLAGPRSHLLGRVGPHEVAAAFAAGDVHVLPSAFEELGSVLVEAMACGIPSVAYDVGGVREAVVPDVTGRLVPGADEEALAAAVRAALTDEAFRTRAHTEGPQIARERFDRALVGERLRDLYGTVCAAAT